MDCSKQGIYIGYFQTYVYASNPSIRETLESISPRNINLPYRSELNKISKTKAILLHIRLTDYHREKQFGIPPLSYYQNALDQLTQMREFSKIWVYSDDVAEAKIILKHLVSTAEICFFENQDISDIEVWSLMRNFHGYIIGNSSFAWWAAFLRIDKSAPVFVPSPWFVGIKEPNLLIPPDWIRVNIK